MRLLFLYSLIISFLFIQTSYSFTPVETKNNSESFPELWNCQDSELQKRLEQLIKKQGLWKQVQKKHLSLVLINITDINHPKMAELNGNKMYYAASLPKLAILLAAFVEIEQGNLKETDELIEHLNKMIRNSSNVSASHVLSLIGGERILEIIQSPKFALYDKEHNGGLWVGKAYSKGTAFRRDPLHNLSHGATGIQAARFYYLLETNQLLSPEYSVKMKEALSKPGINHKFVKGLEGVSGVEIFRKSGSWKNFHADSALIEFNAHKYILIGLSNSSLGGKWMVKLAGPVHKLITEE